jgi:hypothetical protein
MPFSYVKLHIYVFWDVIFSKLHIDDNYSYVCNLTKKTLSLETVV